MMEKLKLRLFQLVLVRKRALLLVCLLILGGVFFAAPYAQAWLDIPYNIAANQLERLDWVENSIIRFLVMLAILVVESTAFLFISASLLDWSSSLEVGLSNNLLVSTGWDFISGLVNISFILIFLYIAISYILGKATREMQQALPRLIIVALLINFSLLLVKMFVDIGWIFQSSFKDAFLGAGTIREAAMQPLIDSGSSLIALLTGILMGFLGTMLIPLPFVGVAGQAAMATFALVGEVFFGMISQTITLIVFNFTAALIFLIYSVLFLIRIVVIWLLAILSPLAFAAAILPKTQKFFNLWLRALFEWVFLGVVIYFLMGLGIMLFGVVSPGAEGITQWPTGLGGWNFLETYYKYIFLFVYLIVVLFLSKKLVPMGADAVWSLGTMGISRGGQLTADLSRKLGMRARAWQLEKKPREEKRLEELQAKPQLELTSKEAKELGRLRGWGSRALRRAVTPRMPPEMAKGEAKALRKTIEEERKDKFFKRLTQDSPEAIYNALLQELRKGVVLRDKVKIDLMEKALAEKRPDQVATARELADPKEMRRMIREETKPGVSEALAKTNVHEKIVGGVMGKINDTDLVKNMQADAFKDAGVVMNLLKNEGTFREMTMKGSAQKKREVQNTLQTSRVIATLSDEDKRLIAKRQNQMSTNPRWRV